MSKAQRTFQITGKPGAGKTTLANAVLKALPHVKFSVWDEDGERHSGVPDKDADQIIYIKSDDGDLRLEETTE